MRKSVMVAVFAALVPLAVASVPAEAVPMLVTSRAALGGNDFIDWADLGPSRTSVSNPFTITSQNGLIVDVSHAGFGDFQRREQGMNINGDFAPGDALLFTLRDGAPISLEFDDLVFGGGAQIQRDAFGAFTATIEAFDAANQSLAFFEISGESWNRGDNSAMFLGILDLERSIGRIEIGLTTDNEPFLINQFDIVGPPPPPTAVSEPGTLALLGASLLGLIVQRRRQAADATSF